MAEIIAFPQEHNLGRARRVAQVWFYKRSQKAKDAYWASTVQNLASSFRRAGFSEREAIRQVNGFRAAVEHEIGNLERDVRYLDDGPGAA